MAGNTRWIRDASGKEHPDDSSLLAYTRGQYLEEQQGLRQHIEQCRRCRHTCSGLAPTNDALDILGQMQARLVYTDVAPAVVLSRTLARAAQQERRQPARLLRRIEPLKQVGEHLTPKKPAVGFHALLPLIILTVLLIISIVLALAIRSTDLSSFVHVGGLIHSDQPGVMGVEQHHTTATPASGSASALGPAGALTPTPAGGPNLRDCTNKSDLKQSQLVICGSGFTPRGRVYVFVEASGGSKVRRPVTADAHGNFQATFTIDDCNVLIVIYAHDLSRKAGDTPPLTIFFSGGCSKHTSSSH